MKLDLNKGKGGYNESDNNDKEDRDKVTNISITLSPLQKDENNQNNFDLSQDYGRNELMDLNQNEKYDKNEDINTNTRKKQIDCKKLRRKYLIGGQNNFINNESVKNEKSITNSDKNILISNNKINQIENLKQENIRYKERIEDLEGKLECQLEIEKLNEKLSSDLEIQIYKNYEAESEKIKMRTLLEKSIDHINTIKSK